jgi:hypothetical protein
MFGPSCNGRGLNQSAVGATPPPVVMAGDNAEGVSGPLVDHVNVVAVD